MIFQAERAPYMSAREGRPWLRSAPVPDEPIGVRHVAPREWTSPPPARIMHVLYVGAQGTAVALEDYAKDLRSRLRVDTQRRRRLELRATASPRSRRLRRCFPVSKSSSRLPPEEAVLERHLREICPLRGRLRGFKSSQSVQHRLTS